MANKIILVIFPLFWPKMPPLGIGYLQSFLMKNVVDIDILDLNNIFYNLSSPELKKSWLISCNTTLEKEILSIIENKFTEKLNECMDIILKYDVVGFSCFKSNFQNTLTLIKRLKKKRPCIDIVLGGPEITRQFFRASGKFEKDIIELSNHIIVGEGELPLLNYINRKAAFPKVSNFCELDSLENLPFPEYKGVDLKRYPRHDAIPILFSRGCVKKCNFCSERLLYKKFRTRPVKSVIDEITYHRQKNRVRYFIFHDSMINADTERLDSLCNEIIKKFGSIKWEAQLYIRDMDEDLLKKMKRSGCYNLFIGLESGCDKTLQRMNKGFSAKDALSLFKKLDKAGLAFGISIITGYPGETEKDFREGLDFIIRNKRYIPKIEQVNPFTYYDGTDADKNYDYSINKTSLERFNAFVGEIKKHGFKYTNAFLGNIVEKHDGI
jgi:radical SAM superfamily enzyme YgiQ (UPF0313 family)